MPDSNDDARPGEWHAAWATALDDLELTLDHTERLLVGEVPEEPDVPTWTPPTLPGAMPAELAERARMLLDRQQLLIQETVTAAAMAKQKLALVDKVSGLAAARTPDRSVYVDISA